MESGRNFDFENITYKQYNDYCSCITNIQWPIDESVFNILKLMAHKGDGAINISRLLREIRTSTLDEIFCMDAIDEIESKEGYFLNRTYEECIREDSNAYDRMKMLSCLNSLETQVLTCIKDIIAEIQSDLRTRDIKEKKEDPYIECIRPNLDILQSLIHKITSQKSKFEVL